MNKYRHALELVVALLLLALGSARAQAAPEAICVVPTATYPTIASAITTATCGVVQIGAGMFSEHNLTPNHPVAIQGQGPSLTIIDGSSAGPVFKLPGDDVSISNLTIQHGKNVLGIGNGVGGGIWANANVTIDNVTFANNVARVRGGHGGAASERQCS